MKWEIIAKLNSKNTKTEDIISALLKNREIVSDAQKKQFFEPINPKDLTLEELGISGSEIKGSLKCLKKALRDKEKIIIFGDYDADGVCSTAILWEAMYALGFKCLPFIPDRFLEGYGLKKAQIEKLLLEHPDIKVIITVDNGIVANQAVDYANSKGIDVIISDHHEPGKVLPKAFSIIHTTKTSGAGIAWIFAREIYKAFSDNWEEKINKSLDLCAIGVVADQMPLVGINRSFVKHGLDALRQTQRKGLNCVFEVAAIKKEDLSTYHLNYVIAPRINAMGRLKHGMDSLRLLCTKDVLRAQELAYLVGQTNEDRQKIVSEVILHAKNRADEINQNLVIVLADESYHEGVIGLAAARLVEEYYRPAIVFSKGEVYSKASARSISGFNMIETLRQLSDMWTDGGGHSMAAGFTLETAKLSEFTKRINEIAGPLLTEAILERKTKVDLEMAFTNINWELAENLQDFEPFGLGNFAPVFAAFGVEIVDIKVIGTGNKHLKMKLKKDKVIDAIFFGGGEMARDLPKDSKIDIIFNLEINEWNGNKSLQLKIKDLRKAEGEEKKHGK